MNPFDGGCVSFVQFEEIVTFNIISRVYVLYLLSIDSNSSTPFRYVAQLLLEASFSLVTGILPPILSPRNYGTTPFMN